MQKKELTNALSIVSPLANSKAFVEAWKLVTINENTLSACDGEIYAQTPLPEPLPGVTGMFAGTKLMNLLKSISCDDVTVTTSGNKLKIKTNKIVGSYAIKPKSKEQEKIFTEPQSDEWKEIPAGVMDALLMAKSTAAKAAMKPVFTGVHIAGNTVMATDSYAIMHIVFEDEIVPEPITISRAVLDYIARMDLRMTHWAMDNHKITFKADNGTMVHSALVYGDFPDAQQFVDLSAKLDKTLTFPLSIIPTLERHMTQLADLHEGDRTMQIKLAQDSITVDTKDSVSMELSEVVESAGIGVSCSFRIQPRLLLSILNQTHDMKFADTESIVAFTRDMKPGKFTYIAIVDWDKGEA